MEHLTAITSIAGTIGIVGFIATHAQKNYPQLKSVFDFIYAFIALFLLSPVFLIVPIIIKLSSKGPVFYFQERVGKDGKVFRMFKFRSMHCDAEKGSGPVWCAKYDNRTFAFGAFMRHHHIDEIPQFINVLKGDMSIIGPRPERPFFVNEFMFKIPRYYERLRVKPGITGYAQVCYRYDTTVEDVKHKLAYEILYIQDMNLMRDILIFFYTIKVMSTGKLMSGERSDHFVRIYHSIIQPSQTYVPYRPVTSTGFLSEAVPSFNSLNKSSTSGFSGKSF